MCKLSFKNNVYIIAKRSLKNRANLDYYLIIPGRGYEYAFTKKYKHICYNAYKNPVMLNKALHDRRPSVALMDLKKYLNYMMAYLVDELGLDDLVIKEKGKYKNRFRYAA